MKSITSESEPITCVGTSPRIWISSAGLESNAASGCEDCACPSQPALRGDTQSVDDLVRRIECGDIDTIAANTELWIEQVEGHHAAMGLLSDRLLVFDSDVYAILQQARHSISIASLSERFPEWSYEIIVKIVALLLDSNILASSGNQGNTIREAPCDHLTSWLHLSNDCNLACTYCYVEKSSSSMSVDTASQAVRTLFRLAVRHDFKRVNLKFAGGEPTLNMPALRAAQATAEHLSRATGIELNSVLLTNGVNVSDTDIQYFSEHQIGISVSLDGVGWYHNMQRPAVPGQKTLDVYGCVIKTLMRMRSFGLHPVVMVTITSINLGGLARLVKELLAHDYRFALNFVRPTGQNEYERMKLGPKPKDLIEILGVIFELISASPPHWSLLSGFCDRANLSVPHEHTCGAGINYLAIDHEGKVSRCQMDILTPVSSIDAIDPILDVRTHEHGWQNASVNDRECRNCLWRYRCSGGCPRLNTLESNRNDSRSPFCAVYKKILPTILRLEALRLLHYEQPWNYGSSH